VCGCRRLVPPEHEIRASVRRLSRVFDLGLDSSRLRGYTWYAVKRNPPRAEPLMRNVPIFVDPTKDVFEIAVGRQYSRRTTEHRRMTRSRFEPFWNKGEPCKLAIEACARRITGLDS
jgi:hypothetical protein